MTNKSVVLGNPLLASGNRTDHCLSIIGDQYTGRLTKDGAELDQAALLNKLDRLQRVQVQLTDEVEFLQERCYQLNEEINEKSRIIQVIHIYIYNTYMLLKKYHTEMEEFRSPLV